MSLTITEALAEIKTINKRLAKKRDALLPFIARQDGVRDPLEKEGGSARYLEAERQSMRDLGSRLIALRHGIQAANDVTVVIIMGTTRTISEWLVWRREIAAGETAFLDKLRQHVNGLREQARRTGATVVAPGAVAEKPSDIVVNLSEQALAKEIDDQEALLGALDGQLSLVNATTQIKE